MEVANKSGSAANVLIKQQPFAEPGVYVTCLCSHACCTMTSVIAKVHEIVTSTNRLIKEKLPPILKSMSLYLANEETEHILFRPIKVQPQYMPCYSI